MNALPENLERYVLESTLTKRKYAFISANDHGLVVDRGGELSWFGLDELAIGDEVSKQLEHFEGMLPREKGQRHVLPHMELVPGRSTEVHLVGADSGVSLLFFDTSHIAERERHFQQKGNEVNLMLRSWGVAIYEEEGGRFRALSPMPSWMRAISPGTDKLEELTEQFPFLENFLVDAEDVWTGKLRKVKWSGTWTEVDARGKEWHLEASAAKLEDGRRILLLQTVGRRHFERQHILQEARSRDLDLNRLRREIEKKEVLLHCIIHDLRSPLSSMVGTMSLVRTRELNEERARELLEVGLESARYQETLIRGILDAFSAEVQSLEYFESESSLAPDLLTCTREVLDGFSAAFEQNLVVAEHRSICSQAESKVVGEESRLRRVLSNLIDNALRHSPENGTLRTVVREMDDAFEFSVEDEGKGVEPGLEKDLFQKFSKGRHGGASGLGLYFCRSTLETWGGTIGYERGEHGGSRFWLRLPRAL